jgi:hypothetical protein
MRPNCVSAISHLLSDVADTQHHGYRIECAMFHWLLRECNVSNYDASVKQLSGLPTHAAAQSSGFR